jgi:hypothetical protein
MAREASGGFLHNLQRQGVYRGGCFREFAFECSCSDPKRIADRCFPKVSIELALVALISLALVR